MEAMNCYIASLHYEMRKTPIDFRVKTSLDLTNVSKIVIRILAKRVKTRTGNTGFCRRSIWIQKGMGTRMRMEH